MKPATLARLAVAGSKTDVLRTIVTALSAGLAVVALLAAATVISISGYADRYTNALLKEAGLRPGVMIALILVAFPVLALAGQCIRLGAPTRDRRLAAIRLAGATPAESVLIATAETATASLVGSSGGLVAYVIARQLIFRPDRFGRLRLPTDVLPPVVVIVLIVLAVPIVTAVIGASLMRRVIVTPLGVVRRTREHGPRPWPGLLIAGGLVLFGVALNHGDETWKFWPDAVILAAGGGTLLVMVGVVLGTGWISYTAGWLLRRYARMPSMLLAGQRLITDPWNGSRTLAALLVTLVAGGITLGLWEGVATQARGYELYNATLADKSLSYSMGGDPRFYSNAYRLVMIVVGLSAVVAAAGMLVALVESIVARRRSYAALTASGVPRRTLAASVLWQTLTPLVPALALALGSGVALTRLGETEVRVESIVVRVPIPFSQLALLGGGALLAVLLAAGAGLLVLRSSTDLEELRV
jgi:hypothetical protein